MLYVDPCPIIIFFILFFFFCRTASFLKLNVSMYCWHDVITEVGFVDSSTQLWYQSYMNDNFKALLFSHRYEGVSFSFLSKLWWKHAIIWCELNCNKRFACELIFLFWLLCLKMITRSRTVTPFSFNYLVGDAQSRGDPQAISDKVVVLQNITKQKCRLLEVYDCGSFHWIRVLTFISKPPASE